MEYLNYNFKEGYKYSITFEDEEETYTYENTTCLGSDEEYWIKFSTNNDYYIEVYTGDIIEAKRIF